MLNVAIIIGSVREGRFGPVVADWFVDQAKASGQVALDVIDLAEVDLPLVMPASVPPAPQMTELSRRLHAADAFVFVTPEYNRSFPASVKNVIDWHYTEWQAKPVGLISYGSMSGGQHAIQALRAVFAELHAVTIRETISFVHPWNQFGEDGRHLDPSAPEQAARALLDQLGWWARALKNARAEHPYGS
ncbi:FMN reductase [Planobispora rosea]|uniref:FMN reductase n=1 Tax=Planobispora rosea TaxID=35762 RepID=A0A8J3S7H4_PLARO|nr:NAD(P)H-dependent oxidoreductase [Planobispora rosea]GGS93924.1 FMN reductase [Planobispora rosea]GIH87387.1 FMN reductase [Planobispora rosea]